MTRVLEGTSHDTATSAGTMATRADEAEAPDSVFSYRELLRLDEALTMSSRETGLRFTLYIGDLGKRTRLQAEELHARSSPHPTDSVLLAVSPGQRVVEVVTGADGTIARLGGDEFTLVFGYSGEAAEVVRRAEDIVVGFQRIRSMASPGAMTARTMMAMPSAIRM